MKFPAPRAHAGDALRTPLPELMTGAYRFLRSVWPQEAAGLKKPADGARVKVERIMFEEMLALLAKPDRYLCVWRDGELYIELVERRARSEVRCSENAARVIAAGGDGLAA